MLESAASAHLDWVWIEFVGLWLLGPLVAVVGVGEPAPPLARTPPQMRPMEAQFGPDCSFVSASRVQHSKCNLR